MNSSSPVICELVVANRWGIVRSAITISAIILMEEEGEDRNGAREIGTKCRRGGSNEQCRDRPCLRPKHKFSPPFTQCKTFKKSWLVKFISL